MGNNLKTLGVIISFCFRNKIRLNPNQALYLLVNNKTLMSLSLTMAEVYSEHAENDGFLYVTYASQEVFGTNIDYSSYHSYEPWIVSY